MDAVGALRATLSLVAPPQIGKRRVLPLGPMKLHWQTEDPMEINVLPGPWSAVQQRVMVKFGLKTGPKLS